MKAHRTLINVITFLLASVALVWFGMSNLVLTQAPGPIIKAEFTDASGLRARNDITMRGVVIGTIKDVNLSDEGVVVDMELNPGTQVPRGTKAMIVRRSPIGELTIELEPGTGAALETGDMIAASDTTPPPDVSETIEVFADFLGSIPSDDIGTVVAELADAVRGRADDLAAFTRASVDLPERLLEIETELESLITNGPDLSGVFADNADTFADDLTQTAALADILRDRRYDLVELYRNGADFAVVAGELLREQKSNLSCFIRDAGDFNAKISAHKDWLAKTLDLNHLFFNAVEQSVQKDSRGWTWFRVQLLPHQEPAARQYPTQRQVPDVFPGKGCSSRYGTGVGPVEGGTVKLAPGSKIRG